MKDVPAPWIALLMLGASFRIWRLLAEDMVLDRPRRWLVRLPQGWEDGDPIPPNYRIELANFISCPWCFGFWISIGIWLLWIVDHDWTSFFCVPLMLSAGVGIVRGKLDPPEDPDDEEVGRLAKVLLGKLSAKN